MILRNQNTPQGHRSQGWCMDIPSPLRSYNGTPVRRPWYGFGGTRQLFFHSSSSGSPHLATSIRTLKVSLSSSHSGHHVTEHLVVHDLGGPKRPPPVLDPPGCFFGGFGLETGPMWTACGPIGPTGERARSKGPGKLGTEGRESGHHQEPVEHRSSHPLPGIQAIGLMRQETMFQAINMPVTMKTLQ